MFGFLSLYACHSNLCDPLEPGPTGVNALLNAMMRRVAAAGASVAPNSTFVFGHSLGGVGARHFVDTASETFAGLALLGTQTNGDSEVRLVSFSVISKSLSRMKSMYLSLLLRCWLCGDFKACADACSVWGDCRTTRAHLAILWTWRRSLCQYWRY